MHRPVFESVEQRLLFAITAAINAQTSLLTVNGDSGDNSIVVSRDAAGTILVNGGAVPVLFGPATTSNTTRIDLSGFGGNDQLLVNESNGSMPRVDLNGGDGNDVLVGGSSLGVLSGGIGDDTIDGNGGDDSVFLGDGNDVFVWNDGDGSDQIDGEAGTDKLVFNGTAADETISLIANATRFKVTRDVQGVSLNVGTLEDVTVNPFAGADAINVDDLTNTGVTNVNVSLSASSSVAGGDLRADSVFVGGTSVRDAIDVEQNGDTITFTGVAATVAVTASEPLFDQLFLFGSAGNDFIDARATTRNMTPLTVDGGIGDDDIFGTEAADRIIGGDGDDFISGEGGNDTLAGDAGNDLFSFDAAEDDDVIEGGAGFDTFSIFTTNGADHVDVAAGPLGHATFTHDFGASTFQHDLNDVEAIKVDLHAGADVMNVFDLTGTDVTDVTALVNSTAPGGGDGVGDSVNVHGSNASNIVNVTDQPNQTLVSGLSATVRVNTPDASDSISILPHGGADTVTVNLSNTPNQAGRHVVVQPGAASTTLNANETPVDGEVTVAPAATSGIVSVNVNGDSVGVANVKFDKTQQLAGLNVQSGGRATLAPGGAMVLKTTSLIIASNATLDLADDDLIIDYATTSPLGTMQSRINQARAGGAWTGTGLTSSAAKTDPQRVTTLAAIEASDFKAMRGTAAKFDNQSVDDTSVLVKFTYYGDANFDGRVTFDDYARIDVGFNQHGSGWTNGDFNGSGKVDFDDYVLIDTAFNAQGTVLSRKR